MYQCPFGLRLHFYVFNENTVKISCLAVSMPFRADAPFLLYISQYGSVNYTSRINALSGWGSISTTWEESVAASASKEAYQCPFGLRLHFYSKINIRPERGQQVSMPSRAKAPFLPIKARLILLGIILLYQCPLGLKLHFYGK